VSDWPLSPSFTESDVQARESRPSESIKRTVRDTGTSVSQCTLSKMEWGLRGEGQLRTDPKTMTRLTLRKPCHEVGLRAFAGPFVGESALNRFTLMGLGRLW
jgi:hypothetical protein